MFIYLYRKQKHRVFTLEFIQRLRLRHSLLKLSRRTNKHNSLFLFIWSHCCPVETNEISKRSHFCLGLFVHFSTNKHTHMLKHHGTAAQLLHYPNMITWFWRTTPVIRLIPSLANQTPRLPSCSPTSLMPYSPVTSLDSVVLIHHVTVRLAVLHARVINV